MNKCIVCGAEGERHHIVFKNGGGFDFPLNYIYLCSEHHRGKNGPHKNRIVDIKYKINMQNSLFQILNKEYYTMDDIKNMLYINPRQVKILVKDIPKHKQGYKSKDIIKKLMGGRFYYEFMLDEYYDEWWNVLDEEVFLKK